MINGFKDTAVVSNALTKSILCGSSAFALLMAVPAFAQDADPIETVPTSSTSDEVGDEVVATGIRQSLQSAQNLKQNADTFVDAITSEDIGALPDRSVTEALQRVPGITISRFAAADDPDHFSIEGTDVVVRGLTYVSSQFNGRDSFSANNGRALSFADVPPELLGAVQVFKNQTADLIEGGIAGTISLETVKPFDRPGRVIAGSLEGNYTDFRDELTPTISGLYSDRWDVNGHEFGLRVNAVSSELKSRSDGSQISSFQPRTDFGADTVYAPEGAVVRTQDYDRKRVGYGAAAQWANPDRTMEATAEFIRSDASTSWGENVSEIATDNIGDDAFFALPGAEFQFGADSLFTQGSLSAPLGWRADQNSGDARLPIHGLQSNNIKRGVEQEYVTSDYSFNFKYTPTDRVSLNFDYQHVDSTVDNVDHTIWGSSFQDIALDLTAGSVPNIEYLTPTFQGGSVDCSGGVTPGSTGSCPSYLIGDNPSLSDPYNTFWRAAMDHIEQSEGTQDAFRADIEYDIEENWLKSVRFGGRYAKRDQTTRSTAYNWGVLSEIWGNGGPVWMDQVGTGQVETYEWDNFQRGNVTQPPALPFYAGNPAQNYDSASDLADQVVRAWLTQGGTTLGDDFVAAGGDAGWARLSQRPGVIPGTHFLPGEISDVVEETTAIYGRLNFGNDDPFGNGISIDGNIGLRYVETNVKSEGFFTAPPASDIPVFEGGPVIENGLPGAPGDGNVCVDPVTSTPPTEPYEPPGFCALTPAEQAAAQAFANGATQALPQANYTYDNFLPSFNLKIGLDDEKIIRFAYSKGMSRGAVGLLRNYFTLSAVTEDDPRTPTVDSPPAGFRDGFYGFEGEGGNPSLNPVTADNFDISFEWYFDDVGSLTVSGFHKRIKDIIDTGSGTQSFTSNGVTYDDVYLVQPGNSPDTGKITGFEIAHQQFYDDILPGWASGFGTAATYTYVDSNGIRSSGVNATSSNPTANDGDAILADVDSLPLAGLSKHNFNLSGIYEKDKISARLSYNWRSDYLVTARDVITPFYPIFQESSGQLDGSFFYTINENFKVGVQAANLLDTVTETTSLIPNTDGLRGFRSAFRNDRRFTFALRANF
ncbi:TonB-dependent receptor [Litorimonas taeanensis]|uniref:TonB-dependent receptor n=1 Tax=Litorimonas taeanensis TaxID=568099 RepID=A0A420WJR7_9PROT|nr:TonB-dependent receptor [Litorimonas taeanensis]RKQ71166.1 TonB-dependent receptor [Litorimonas taeanensis]